MDVSRKDNGVVEFGELIPNAHVRFTTINGVQYLSVKDLIMVICGHNEKRASEAWINFSEEKKLEISNEIGTFKFPEKYQRCQNVITFPGAIKLMMWLGGNKAKTFRTQITKILTKYFAGDKSLLAEVQANAESNLAIHQFARQTLSNPKLLQGHIDNNEQIYSKRKRIDEDRIYAEVLRDANPLFERRLELQVQFVNNRERWLAVDLKGEKDRLEVQRIHNEMEFEKQQNMLQFERSKLLIAKESHNEELEYKRALKALEAPSPPSIFMQGQSFM